ncbi:glycosyltransferase [Chloroflexota bacterium]
MNILFLALEPPYPPNDGGRIRTYNIVKQVSKHHSVTLLTSFKQSSDDGELGELRQYCQEIYIIHPQPTISRSLINKIKDLKRRYPVALDEHTSDEMRTTIESLVNIGRFDVIHIDQIYLAQYVDLFGRLPSVLTHHNVESIAQRRWLWRRHDRFLPRWWGYWLEYYRWYRYEIEVSGRFDALAVVSEQEAEYYKARVQEVPVFVVPNGVDTNYFQPVNGINNPPSLLFTGRMNYFPNVDAMQWFCKEIYPLVRQEIPEVTLSIVGREPLAEIQSLDSPPSVVVTGEVDDVRPYFAQSSIFVVPLRFGSGTRLKILEAMALGLPVISTSMGSEGLDVTPGKDLLLADSSQEFASQIISLLKNKNSQIKMANSARQTVEELYDWAIIAQQQERVYEAAIAHWKNRTEH